MIEVGPTFWIMLIAMWVTIPMALFLGVAWGRVKERDDWNDWIAGGMKSRTGPPEKW